MRLISQLINDILESFNSTIISIFLVTSLPVWPVILAINLNETLLSARKSKIQPALFKAVSSVVFP